MNHSSYRCTSTNVLLPISKKKKDGHFLNNSTTEGDRDLIFSVLERGESGLSNCVKSDWWSN